MAETSFDFMASHAPRAGDLIVGRLNRRSVGLLIVTESANHCLFAPCATMWEALQRAREVAAASAVDVWHYTSENTFECVASYRIDPSRVSSPAGD
jgi:hypothetical protein